MAWFHAESQRGTGPFRSDDSWFRPVDLQLGPDGALYVADFYNRIIGHYEVPLDHPGRDREKGRIWRIVYRGNKSTAHKAQPDLATANTDELIAELADPNISRRMLAMNRLTDHMQRAAIPGLLKTVGISTNSHQKVHAAWALHRFGALEENALLRLAKDSSPHVRLHAMRILSERQKVSDELIASARERLEDGDAFVQRGAADALGQHPATGNVAALVAVHQRVSSEDENLVHVVKMALRNQLRAKEAFSTVKGFGGIGPGHQSC